MRLTELASDLEALRADLAEELLAINRYESQAFSLADEVARDGSRASSMTRSSTSRSCSRIWAGWTSSSARSWGRSDSL